MNKKIQHLNQQTVDDVCFRLSQVHSGLLGLATLFEMLYVDDTKTLDQLSGVGPLLRQLSKELVSLEDTLNCATIDLTSGHEE